MLCSNCIKNGYVSFLKKDKKDGASDEALLYCPECGKEDEDTGIITDYDIMLDERK